MFLINSCLGLFSATSFHWYPFSLTYGVNLPSSLTTLLPFVLGFSPHLPVSVCGTGTLHLDSGFSCQCGICRFGTYFPSSSRLRIILRFSLQDYLPRLYKLFQLLARLIPLRPHISHSMHGSTGIFTCCPSPTRLRLGLGPDLPWVDKPSPGILRLSTVKILTLLSLLIPAFSLLPRPHVFPVVLLPTTVSSPTTHVFYYINP